MNLYERGWPFLRRRRARRAQEAEAIVQRDEALRDWVVDVVPDHPHEEAVDLFIEKVKRERIYNYGAIAPWASEALDSKTFEVVREGVARLDAEGSAAKRRVMGLD